MDTREQDLSGTDLVQGFATDPAFLRTLVSDAAAAIVHLWDPARKSFWRSTEHRSAEEKKAPKGVFPTVTFRSLEALLRLIEEYPAWADSALVKLALEQAIP